MIPGYACSKNQMLLLMHAPDLLGLETYHPCCGIVRRNQTGSRGAKEKRRGCGTKNRREGERENRTKDGGGASGGGVGGAGREDGKRVGEAAKSRAPGPAVGAQGLGHRPPASPPALPPQTTPKPPASAARRLTQPPGSRSPPAHAARRLAEKAQLPPTPVPHPFQPSCLP